MGFQWSLGHTDRNGAVPAELLMVVVMATGIQRERFLVGIGAGIVNLW